MKYLIILSAFLPALAFAGGTEGHGADAIVCREPETKETIEKKVRKIVKQRIEGVEYPTLLDYHEGFRIGKTIGLGSKEDSVRTKFEKMMTRLEAFFPAWTKKLRAEAEPILKAIEQHTPGKVEMLHGVLFTNEIMKDLDDDKSISYPEGCAKEQFVIRSTGEIPDQPDYMIKRDILEASDSDILSGMVFHEVAFKHSVEEEKILVSPGSRYIVRNVASPEADGFDYASYTSLLGKAKFTHVYFEVAGASLFANAEKRPDGRWQARLQAKYVLSDGAEEDIHHTLVWENGRVDNEATRVANPRRVSYASFRSSSFPTIKVRVADQTCTASRQESIGSYTVDSCTVYLLRGEYDYEIQATTRGKYGLSTWRLTGTSGKGVEKIEKKLTTVTGRVVIR